MFSVCGVAAATMLSKALSGCSVWQPRPHKPCKVEVLKASFSCVRKSRPNNIPSASASAGASCCCAPLYSAQFRTASSSAAGVAAEAVKLTRATIRDGDSSVVVHCSWSDGSAGRFDALWLRDHDPSTTHQDSGQRTKELKDIARDAPEHVAVAEAGRALQLSWPGQDPTSSFDASWLWQHCSDRHDHCADERTSSTTPRPWRPSDFAEGGRLAPLAPTSSWARVVHDDSSLLDCLRALRRDGFVLVSDCPLTERATEELAWRFGRLQDTFYGGPIWDTAPRRGRDHRHSLQQRALPLHTDCTYLKHQPDPALQLCRAMRGTGRRSRWQHSPRRRLRGGTCCGKTSRP